MMPSKLQQLNNFANVRNVLKLTGTQKQKPVKKSERENE